VVAGQERITRVPGGVGTGGYMAPEVPGGAAPDPRQDLYAVGVLARRLLTGLPPGSAHHGARGDLDALLDRLVDPDPGARPATAAEALAGLRSIGMPSDAPWLRDPDRPDVVDLFARRRRVRARTHLLTAVLGFVVAVPAGAIGAWLMMR
jgi:serine/threonine protein kinase